MKLGIFVIISIIGALSGTFAGAISGSHLQVDPLPHSGTKVDVEPRAVTPGSEVVLSYKNPELSAEQTVFAHYGFNGWNLQFSGALEDFPMGNRSFYKRIPMSWNEVKSRFETTVSIPAGSRALHFVFCWDLCAVGQWDNNRAQDFAWPITFPYIGPLLSWDSETSPDSGIVISFESALEADGWVELHERYGQAQRFSARRVGTRHVFRFTDLKPNTTYFYRVGAGRDLVSKQYSFKTTQSLDRIEKLSFVVMGDAQDDGENQQFSLVAEEILATQSDIDLIVSPGDLPWNDRPGDWWTFFDKGRNLLGQKVFMPAIGNHDSPGNGSNEDSSSFRRYFPALPYQSATLPYYKFSLFNVRFFVLSSEHPDSMLERGEQYRWLDREFDQYQDFRENTQDSRTFWSFVLWHIPPYNAGARHAGQQFSFREIAQHFNANVDWYFGGHEHLYQRSQPLNFKPFGLERKPRYGDELGDGTGLIVVPPMGAIPNNEIIRNRSRESGEILENLAFPDHSGEQTEVDSFIGYCRIDLDGNSFDLRTFGLRNQESGRFEVVDSLSYEK